MGNLFGLLGEKLGHSMSPEIHSLIFEALNIEGCYHLFEVDKTKLKDAVLGLKALNAKGVNVTIPYKVPVMEYIDEISPEADKIGSVNTICFSGNKTVGYNTDYYGFGMMLEANGITPAGKKALVLGTGGASKGVIQYLSDNRTADIVIVSREKDKVSGKLREFNIVSYSEAEELGRMDIIINCTPCGMYPNAGHCPVEPAVIKKFSTAVDLIYNPRETLFLKYSRECGLKSVNGMYMLVAQAVVAQELWNSIKIDRDVTDMIYGKLK